MLGEPVRGLVVLVDADGPLTLTHLLDAARRQRRLAVHGDQPLTIGGMRMPPQSLATVREVARRPCASVAETTVVPQRVGRSIWKRAVNPPVLLLTAVTRKVCLTFATTTVTCSV